MVKFQTRRKGYDTKEVEDYLAKQEMDFYDTGRRQTERIDEQKVQITRLLAELDGYRAKENSINQALLASVEKAKEMDCTAKIRFALEGERVKIFEAKWVSYCKENTVKSTIKDPTIKYLQGVGDEIEKMLDEEFGLPRSAELLDAERQFGDELRRISALDKKRPQEREDAFNLDDLGNVSRMSEICKRMLDENRI